MATENKVVSIEFDVTKRIDAQVTEILEHGVTTLPDGKHPLVSDYVLKIEGSYDVSRSKEDTDNAIDLLYIAYNTTPQVEAAIRPRISELMAALVGAQQQSKLKMDDAVADARAIVSSTSDLFGSWKDARDSKKVKLLKNFLRNDLCDLVKDIKRRAERISADLAKIAVTYDGIIDSTIKTTSQSEQALAARLKNKEDIEKEIAKSEADSKRLESLVKDLQIQITKYDQMASDYKARAETAEERAFIMSIVSVGAQMISAAIPAIVAGATGAATGGTSLIAASAAGTVRQLTNSEAATTDSDSTAKLIETKKEIADKVVEKATADREKSELEKKASDLKVEKEKIEGDKGDDADTKAARLAGVDKRIEANEADMKDKDSKVSVAANALTALNASLKSLDKNMGKMAEKNEEQATSLRQLQMQMLNKIEAFETEKRTQASQLVMINALLVGNRTDAETIELAIKSLNLSLKALKRVQEIIVEISFFFKSFAAFMQQILESVGSQSATIQSVMDRDGGLTVDFMNRIKRNTNDFFVTQNAEWQAVEIVSAKFVENFQLGWTKLNALNGNFLTEGALVSYLSTAAEEITTITKNRIAASTAKLAELAVYRDRIMAKA